MRNSYVLIGPVLSCLLVLAGPRLTQTLVGARHPATVTPPVTTVAQQLAQDESNDSNAGPQSYQPGEDNSAAGGDNSDQPNAQPGDESGDDSAQANPSDNDNGGESPQMNAGPGDSDNPEQNNQDSNDSQSSEGP